MNLFLRVLVSTIFGSMIGAGFGRPAFGALIGGIIGALVPLEQYFPNSFTLGFLSFLVLIVILPPFVSLLGLILLVPLMIVYNLSTPKRANQREGNGFTFLEDEGVNEIMVKLMAGLTSVDSTSRDQQAQAVKRFIDFNGSGFSRSRLWKIYRRSLNQFLDTSELSHKLSSGTSLGQQKFFLQVLTELANVDGSVSEQEKTFIRKVAGNLQVSDRDVETILDSVSTVGNHQSRWSNRRQSRHRQNNRRPRQRQKVKDAYETLDVPPSSSRRKVKEAYQKKVKQYHPDQHRDGEGDLEEAEEKMAEINQAYQRIKEEW